MTLDIINSNIVDVCGNIVDIRCGDIVEVISPGSVYPRFTEMVDSFKMDNWKIGRLINVREGKLFEVKGINKHLNRMGKVVCFIESMETGHQFLINVMSVRMVSREEFINQEEFCV